MMELNEKNTLLVDIENVDQNYNKLHVIDNVSLTLKSGESVGIMSSSGAGKSTLLRIMLRLEKPSGGTITNMLKPGDIGAAFQDDNLLPWLDVRENICLLNQLHNKVVNEVELDEILTMSGLQQFSDYYPNQLSGGMKQKVAVARLLLYKPKIYFLDETMANMDDFSRFALCDNLYSQVVNSNHSIFFITHSLTDALHLSDRILIGGSRPLKNLKEFRNPLPRKRNYTIRFEPVFKEILKELQNWLGYL